MAAAVLVELVLSASPDTGAAVLAFLGALAAIGFLVGWKSRITGWSATAAVALVPFLDVPQASADVALLVITCILLVLSDAGAYLSVDSRWREPSPAPKWPVTLLKLQVSVVYLIGAIGMGALVNFQGDAGRPNDVLATLWGAGTLSAPPPALWFATASQAYLAFALWRPNLRSTAFPLGLCLHGWILFSSAEPRALVVPLMITLGLHVLFLQVRPGERFVVWDDQCSFCRSWIGVIRRLDWLSAHKFVGSSDDIGLSVLAVDRAAADRAIQLVSKHEHESGFNAVRAILELLPVSFLWAPLLRIPPIPAIGARAYAMVAARRRCSLALPASGV